MASRGQISTLAQVGSGTSLATSWGTNPTAGSKVLLFVQCASVPTSVVDNGVTPTTYTLDKSTLAGKGVHIYHADNISLPAAGAYQVTVNVQVAGTIQVIGIEYIGAATGGPVATNNGGATGTAVSTGAAGGSEGSIYFGGFSDASALNPETITFNSGPTFTEQARNTNGSSFWPMAMADAIIAGGGSQSIAWTLGDSVAWGAALCVYATDRGPSFYTPPPRPSIYRPLYSGRYRLVTPTVSSQLGPAGRVNSASINANSAVTGPYSVSLGVACLAGDLIVVVGASNGTHVANGMSVYDSVNGVPFPTIGEEQNSNSSSRYTQAFAYVTPVDLPLGTVLWFTPYAAVVLSAFAADVFRGWSSTQVATATLANSPLGVAQGAPGFAVRPPRGSLVIMYHASASAASLQMAAPYNLGSNGNTNGRVTIGYTIATGVDPYDSTVVLGSAQSWGVINAAFAVGQGPVGAWYSEPRVRGRNFYILPYQGRYRWTAPPTIPPSTGTLFQQALTASLSFSGAIKNANAKQMTAGLSFTGADQEAVSYHLTAALSFTGALIKANVKALAAASLSFTGALASSHLFLKALSGALSFTGALLKSTAYHLTAALSFTGAQTRALGKQLTGALSFTGALARRVAKSMTATLSFTGALNTRTSKLLAAAALSFNGAIVNGKHLSQALTGTLSFNGALAAVHAIGKTLSGVLSFTGAMQRSTSKQLAAALSFVGAQVRQTRKQIAGALSFSGAFSRVGTFHRTLTATLSFVGNLARIYTPFKQYFEQVIARVREGYTVAKVRGGKVSAVVREGFTYAKVRSGKVIALVREGFTILRMR